MKGSVALNEALDNLRLGDSDLESLLDVMDQNAMGAPGQERRPDARYRYRQTVRVRARVDHPGGTTQIFRVKVRNLSRTGMGFLHGSFLHQGTRVCVYLVELSGKEQPAEGQVVRVRHVRGQVHEIGVRFAHPINLAQFVRFSEEDSQASDKVSWKFTGHLLCVHSNPDLLRIDRVRFEDAGMKVTVAASLAVAQTAAKSSVFDVVALEVADASAAKAAVQAMRDAGCKCPLLAITGEGADAAALKSEGFAAVLRNSFDQFHALRALRDAIGTEPQRGATPPLVSALWHQPGMQPLIAEFVDRLRTSLAAIEAQIAANDVAAVAGAIAAIKAGGEGFGYPCIASVAAAATAQAGPAAIAAAQAQLAELKELASGAAIGLKSNSA